MEGLPSVKNNNWTNLKQLPANSPRGIWKYSDGQDAAGHAKFCSVEGGLRATICDLSHDMCESGKDTLRKLFEEFAPASDTLGGVAGAPANDPLKYAQHVAGRVGTFIADYMRPSPETMTIDTPLKIFIPNRAIAVNQETLLTKMLRAMVEYEIKSGWMVPDYLLHNAILLYKTDFRN